MKRGRQTGYQERVAKGVMNMQGSLGLCVCLRLLQTPVKPHTQPHSLLPCHLAPFLIVCLTLLPAPKGIEFLCIPSVQHRVCPIAGSQ